MAKSIDISHSTDVEMGESSQYVSAAEEVDQTTAVLSSTSSLQVLSKLFNMDTDSLSDLTVGTFNGP